MRPPTLINLILILVQLVLLNTVRSFVNWYFDTK